MCVQKKQDKRNYNVVELAAALEQQTENSVTHIEGESARFRDVKAFDPANKLKLQLPGFHRVKLPELIRA